MRFLVVIVAPRPKDLAAQQQWGRGTGITLRWVSECSRAAAAALCDVRPGGKAHVIAEADIETFTRAEMAPLVSGAPTVTSS